jgi:hypothetical protein
MDLTHIISKQVGNISNLKVLLLQVPVCDRSSNSQLNIQDSRTFTTKVPIMVVQEVHSRLRNSITPETKDTNQIQTEEEGNQDQDTSTTVELQVPDNILTIITIE